MGAWWGDGSLTPVQVNRLNSIVAIADGGSYAFSHCIALKSDGTVWTWGYNFYGQLGNGTYNDSQIPVQVTGLSGVTAIAGGETHTLALKSDGTIWAWGGNEYGQLGDGTTTLNATPVQVSGLNLGVSTLPTPSPSSSPSPTPSPTPTPAQEGIILGYVYDEDENPLKGVTVHITGTNYSGSMETDEEGYYEFTGLAAGDYTLAFEKEGYKTENRDVSLEEGDTMYIDDVFMEEVQKGSIYGYVVDIRGDALEKVRLKLTGVKTKVTNTESSDRDGFFNFEDLDPDTYRIAVSKRFYRKVNKVVELEEGEDEELEIELKRTTRRGILLLSPSEDTEQERNEVH